MRRVRFPVFGPEVLLDRRETVGDPGIKRLAEDSVVFTDLSNRFFGKKVAPGSGGCVARTKTSYNVLSSARCGAVMDHSRDTFESQRFGSRIS